MIGLSSVSAYIDKCKLMFLGRLSTTKIVFCFKILFCFCYLLTEIYLNIYNNQSKAYDLFKTLQKYDLSSTLEVYQQAGYFPSRNEWKDQYKDVLVPNGKTLIKFTTLSMSVDYGECPRYILICDEGVLLWG